MSRCCRVLAVIVVCLLVGLAAAFEGIAPVDAIHHVGERATVCGRVASAKYAESSRGSPTFLNLDKPYPNHVFTALIWGSDRSHFSSPPETLSGTGICVTGTIGIYRGRAQIEVSKPSQIRSMP